MDAKFEEWDNLYKHKDNFMFYPHEDVVRFVSKYIKKRVGLNEFIPQARLLKIPKVLDFGCRIGRHVKLLDEFKLDAYGFDLSQKAIKIAKELFDKQDLHHLTEKVIVANIIDLPYDDKFFNFMLSHGVVDSMPFNIAKKGLKELHRCLSDDGYIYLDLISVEDSSFKGIYEQLVQNEHEKGTIQYYYDLENINKLFEEFFEIVEIIHNKKHNIYEKSQNSRYHLVLKKKI